VNGLKIGLSAVALIMAVFMAFESAHNRALQEKVGKERETLARAQTFTNLDNSLVQLLAKTAAEKNDQALRNLLADNGVTFKVEPNAGGAAGSAPASGQGASQ